MKSKDIFQCNAQIESASIKIERGFNGKQKVRTNKNRF